MKTYKFSKESKRKIFKSYLLYMIPYILLIIALVFFQKTNEVNSNEIPFWAALLTFLFPFLIIVVVLFFVILLGVNKLIDSSYEIGNEKLRHAFSSHEITINLGEIRKLKETRKGLYVFGGKKKILISKHVEDYNEIKNALGIINK